MHLPTYVEIARVGSAEVGLTNDTNMLVTVSRTVSQTHVSKSASEPPSHASPFDRKSEVPGMPVLEATLIEKR